MVLTVQLGHDFLRQISLVLELQEDVLGDICLLLRCGPSEVVETYVEPIVYAFVQGVIFVAQLLRSTSVLKSFGLSCRAILVGPTNIEGIAISCFAISMKWLAKLWVLFYVFGDTSKMHPRLAHFR